MRATDVAVVGGGPAGLATAIALAQHGVAVTVLERDAIPAERIGESVPAALGPLLCELGAWQAFSAQSHLRSAGNASAWTDAQLLRSDALRSRAGGGWHLDRASFETMLRERAVAAGAQVHCATRVVGVEPGSVHAVAGGRTLALGCRVIVDATGVRATVARWLGAQRLVEDRLVCTYTRLRAPRARAARERRALVEAVEQGWWYATPLPGGGALAALFCEPRTAHACGYRVAAAWQAALRSTRHIAGYLAEADGDQHAGAPRPQPRVTAAISHRLDHAAGRDWLALGDAAAALDPLASAGITLALRDAITGAAAITRRLGGDAEALVAHSETLRHRFAAYSIQRRQIYALAEEWESAPFWRQRNKQGVGRSDRDGPDAPVPRCGLLR